MYSSDRLCNPKNWRNVASDNYIANIISLALGPDESFIMYLDLMLLFDLQEEGVL